MLKNKPRIIFAFVALLLPTLLSAQELKVVSKLKLTQRQEATRYERRDLNGNLCAMVVLLIDNDNLDFEGDIRTHQYRSNGEWWIWMTQDANWLTIKSIEYTPLRLEFAPLQAGRTYEVRVEPASPMQMLVVTDPLRADFTMTDAAKNSRVDASGRACALARIGLVLPEAKFVGAVHSVYRGGEWWVWLAPGTNQLTVQARGYQPLTVRFTPVESSVTYLMTLLKAGSMPTPPATSPTPTSIPAANTSVASNDILPIILPNGVRFNMIRVHGGTFDRGATSEQGSDAYDDEKPVHKVTLSTYYIGETEVTQELWKAVMGSNPSYFSSGSLKRPVENVSWNECQEFIRKLNALTGKTFRLPTEAEWEFAARGGTKSRGYKYSGGNDIGSVAWYDGNAVRSTHDVKTKQPNELGIYDMSGNVWEWCQDWYGKYSAGSQSNPKGPSSGSNRVIGGGSWYLNPRDCRASLRSSYNPDYRYLSIGLRLFLVS